MSDNSNNMDKEEAWKRQRAEMEAYRRLMDAMATKADQLRERYGNVAVDSSSGESSSSFRLEPHEVSVLQRISTSGIREGLAVSVLTLFAARRIRSALMKRAFERVRQNEQRFNQQYQSGPQQQSPMQQMIQQRQLQKQQQQQQQAQHQQSSSNNPFHNNNKQQQQNQQQQNSPNPQPGFISNTLGWAIDIAFAMSVGATVTMYSANVAGLIRELSELPLAPGRSTLSREFCPVAVQWLQQLQLESRAPENKALRHVLQQPLSQNTAGFLQLAKNCGHRMRYEATLRKEKGIADPNISIEIPEPGVPVDELMEDSRQQDSFGSASLSSSSSSSEWGTDEATFSTGEFNNDDHSSNSNSNNNNNWADGFVQDQEEDSGNRPS